MEVKIKLTKQLLATAKLAVIMSMPEETENINKYLDENSEEVIDLDLSIYEGRQRLNVVSMIVMLIMAQKAKADGN